MFTPDIILLSVALLILALIMVLGFIHIGRSIKAQFGREQQVTNSIEEEEFLEDNSELPAPEFSELPTVLDETSFFIEDD